MIGLLHEELYLQHDGCEFVMWRRRCYNKQADQIADVTLQNPESAHIVLECWHTAVAEMNLLFFADGGAGLKRGLGLEIGSVMVYMTV